MVGVELAPTLDEMARVIAGPVGAVVVAPPVLEAAGVGWKDLKWRSGNS